jgi:hypothetical protein
MSTLFTRITSLFATLPATGSARQNMARRLMEAAQSRGGSSAAEARELRRAALAQLRVVR